MASVAHTTTKARKTNQMTARTQRSALDKPLRTELDFPFGTAAGRRPGSDTRAESGSIVMPAHTASKTRVKAHHGRGGLSQAPNPLRWPPMVGGTLVTPPSVA